VLAGAFRTQVSDSDVKELVAAGYEGRAAVAFGAGRGRQDSGQYSSASVTPHARRRFSNGIDEQLRTMTTTPDWHRHLQSPSWLCVRNPVTEGTLVLVTQWDLWATRDVEK
jgi:hypothetical protein